MGAPRTWQMWSLVGLAAMLWVGCGGGNGSGNGADGNGPDGGQMEDVGPNDDVPSEPLDTQDIQEEPDADEPDLPPIDPDSFDDGVADDPSAVDQGQVVAFDPEQVPEDFEIFSLGVSSGGMVHDSALFWGYSATSEPATLRIWRPSDNDGEITLVYDERLTPDDGGYFKVRVEGLASGTWYRFAFFAPAEQGEDEGEVTFAARSEIGDVRTALGPGGFAPIKIGAATCTNFRFSPYRSLLATSDEGVDVFINVGDISYNDPAQNLDEYRGFWRQTLEDPGYRAVLSSSGSYITWDDHEVDNNWNPERIGAERLAAAKQAYFETLPVDRGPDNRLWHSYQWGDTAEFMVLDSRSERLPSTRRTDDPIYFSRQQMDWLKERLINSTAHFKILLNSVPITRMPDAWLFQDDRWQGYDAQRQELIDFILDNDIHNVWFLAGDFHVGFVGRVEPEGPGRRMWEIAVGPGGNGPNPLPELVNAGLLEAEQVFPVNQFRYGNGMMEVMTTLEFNPIANNVRVRFVDALTFEVLFDEVLSEED